VFFFLHRHNAYVHLSVLSKIAKMLPHIRTMSFAEARQLYERRRRHTGSIPHVALLCQMEKPVAMSGESTIAREVRLFGNSSGKKSGLAARGRNRAYSSA
jgi:hypothetical protein